MQVPMGGDDRMRDFPPLVPQDFELIGQGPTVAVCDIKLSSAGTPITLKGKLWDFST